MLVEKQRIQAASGPIPLQQGHAFARASALLLPLLILASIAWSARAEKWILHNRRGLWQIGIFFYLVYLEIVLFVPEPLAWLSQLAPFSRYTLATIPFVLYGLAAWRFWQGFRQSR